MTSPSWLIEVERKLYAKNEFNDILAQLETKIGVPRLYIVVGLCAFVVLAFIIGNAGLLLCNVVGFAYPAIASIRAIESRENAEDDKKWLTYWIVFALLVVFEIFAGTLIFLIPFYSVLKCALLVWLMAPGANNGSLFVYQKLIRPIFLQVENDARAILPPGATHEATE